MPQRDIVRLKLAFGKVSIEAGKGARDAGDVLARLFPGGEGTANLLCEDGVNRPFMLRYYASNGMWRLNVPNSTPSADWVRENRDGIALVETTEKGQPAFRIVRPGPPMLEIVNRSLRLGTWGKTSTRLYGWL
jgi:hypothetical protein